MRGDPGEGVPRVPISPKWPRFPMNPFVAEELKAREYPQKYHWKTMMEKEAIQAQIMDSADFLRARPEYRKPRPGIISKTIHDETMIYAWSPGSNHWFKFMTAVLFRAMLARHNGRRIQH